MYELYICVAACARGSTLPVARAACMEAAWARNGRPRLVASPRRIPLDGGGTVRGPRHARVRPGRTRALARRPRTLGTGRIDVVDRQFGTATQRVLRQAAKWQRPGPGATARAVVASSTLLPAERRQNTSPPLHSLFLFLKTGVNSIISIGISETCTTQPYI